MKNLGYAEACDEVENIRGCNKQMDHVISMYEKGEISASTCELLCNRYGDYDYMIGADDATIGDYAT